MPPAGAPLPLTEAQSGLWYAQALDPANPIFNTGHYLDLRGPLDLPAFQAAVDGMVAEADALALRIEPRRDGPVQSVEEARRPWLEVVDLSAEAEPEAAALAAMARDMDTPVDPARHRLAREVLFRLGPQRHLWYQRAHHLALDAFGTDLTVRRVADLYAARAGHGGPGRPLAAFAVAQAEDAAYRAGPRRAADAAYWRQALADSPEVAGMAPGTAVSARRAHRCAVPLPEDVAPALAELGQPWPDVLAALAGAYVRRHAGGAEAVIGVTFMGRLGSPAARVPCTLMNILPARLRLDEEAPLPEALREVARMMVEGRRHGRYRSEQMRRDLGRLAGGRRLFGPLVNLLPFGTPPDLPGLAVSQHVLGTGPVDDITFSFRGGPTGAGLRLEVEANPNLYSDAAARAHAMRLAGFIAAALRAPRLAEVPTATPEEAEWLLRGLNATDHPLPDTTLVRLIAPRLRERPGAEALVMGDAAMSFAELDARSAALAGALRARGAGPGAIVAVALERSFELMVGLLAVLRAGAAYLPLDPTHPPRRIARILANARPVALLTEAALPGDVPLLPPGEWPREGSAPEDGPSPEDAAYVLYTSGSTGEPKGVVVQHHAIVNRLEWMRQHYGFTTADRILQKTPITFDVSVWELFLPLTTGATLVLAPPGAHRDPVALAEILRRQRIGTAHFVPSMLAAFLAEPGARGIRLDRVFCSGEELTPELRDRFHATCTAELHNLYGPTEAAVDVSYWPAAPGDASRPVPIGFPVWNTQLYVLDDAMRPVPPGVAGHLFIGGVQLAREYLGRPDLTAAAFLPSPFRAGERIYRTGDLAMPREDGAILFLGRSDHQVKIRGLRIELGEIEAALASSPLLRQARVIAREDRAGDKRLVAYLVPAEGYDAEALRAHVAARVPDYMVPAAFVALEALPVTSSGKLDRAALPAPALAGGAGRPPRTEDERRMAGLFAEVLGLESLGAEDDFFALGGHSLLAVELMLRVRESWGWDPGLGALFEHPTVARLAALMAEEAGADHGLSPLVRLSPGDAALPPLFLVHPAGGISWCYGGLARALSPRRPVHGLQAPALEEGVASPASLEALADEYVARVLAATPHDTIHLGGWSVGGIIAQAMAVRLRALGRRVGVLAMLDSYPTDVWRDQPEPDEKAPLRALLAIGGFDPDRLPEPVPLERDSVAAFLRRSNSPLGRLPVPALNGVVRVVQGNNRLVRAHGHARYDGTILHFRAALDHAGQDLHPRLWQPYAAAVAVEDIPSLHANMTGPEATARIAPILSAHLLARDQEDRS
ncbi:amino acid adenylation domain-containing protein (plasmid) [Roseomonas marmotae]|uniref:Amino acid adenylation domain-containing protein n=2 Tax=Roseomonas marmotae TaxID=2768161 RepID=A0ABS3KAU0_9PROT|nr:non-ribosomal peptide synthetase [Roseomonas marmotae]MBO1074557.1 amino acid adenylation domain-containing protein [Roseomonas marmotae]QTI81744.1 amino acid adenylation domain-containing protein [Roseomonas marmotae]